MAAGLAVDVLPLIPTVVALGGGVRVGLEDAPFRTQRSNVELVDAAVDAIQKAGASQPQPPKFAPSWPLTGCRPDFTVRQTQLASHSLTLPLAIIIK